MKSIPASKSRARAPLGILELGIMRICMGKRNLAQVCAWVINFNRQWLGAQFKLLAVLVAARNPLTHRETCLKHQRLLAVV